MATVLVTARAGQMDFRQAHDREIGAGDSVDYITDDLAGFLEKVNASFG